MCVRIGWVLFFNSRCFCCPIFRQWHSCNAWRIRRICNPRISRRLEKRWFDYQQTVNGWKGMDERQRCCCFPVNHIQTTGEPFFHWGTDRHTGRRHEKSGWKGELVTRQTKRPADVSFTPWDLLIQRESISDFFAFHSRKESERSEYGSRVSSRDLTFSASEQNSAEQNSTGGSGNQTGLNIWRDKSQWAEPFYWFSQK